MILDQLHPNRQSGLLGEGPQIYLGESILSSRRSTQGCSERRIGSNPWIPPQNQRRGIWMGYVCRPYLSWLWPGFWHLL